MTPIRQAAAEHECAHVMVARYLGTGVVSCVAHHDGTGLTVLAHREIDADELFRSAVIASAGPAHDLSRGVYGDGSAGDLEKVRRFRAEFVALTGREMDDPVRAAERVLRHLVCADAFDRVAAALETGRTLTGAEIEALASTQADLDADAARAMATHRRLLGIAG